MATNKKNSNKDINIALKYPFVPKSVDLFKIILTCVKKKKNQINKYFALKY